MKNMKILVLLDNSFTNDRRVHRIAKGLVDAGNEVTLLAVKKEGCLDKENIDGIDVERIFEKDIFDIKNKKCFKNYAKQVLENYKFDIVHANDQTMLNLGALLKKSSTDLILVYDSHELFSEWPLNVSNYNSYTIMVKSYIVRKLQIRREKRNSQYIDYLITVNESLAKHLTPYFKLKHEALVLRNIPEKSEKQTGNSNILRTHFNIPDKTKILAFIGANIYAKTLNLEQVIKEFANVSDRAIVFICAFNQNAQPIRDLVANQGIKNVYFHDLIQPKDIPNYLGSADIGLVPTWNKNDLSYWYALDNKLFEYMNAGIPILATAQPEYKRIIDDYHCGLAIDADQKNAYLDGFNAILENYDFYKEQTRKASQQLNWENEEEKLLTFYKDIITH